jgi:hypothetical protein
MLVLVSDSDGLFELDDFVMFFIVPLFYVRS